MPIKFEPNYAITSEILGYLLSIEAARERAVHLPVTPAVLASLRETARLLTTHYSTMIEGNKLDSEQVQEVVKHAGHFPGRERDEREVKGYYAALAQVERWATKKVVITEELIQSLHALVMSDGKTKVKPTPYRDGQNVIRDSRTRAIVYMPPEAKDVQELMAQFVKWLQEARETLPCPIVAAIAHYQFATIHPYYDGNGRTTRLLATLILHLGNYDFKGIYSLEEYYARDLAAYYGAISVGEHHNYYMGRAEADITNWVEYFIKGMLSACESVLRQMADAGARGSADQSALLRVLDPRQRKVLELFGQFEVITSGQIGELFGTKPRTNTQICSSWVAEGFLEVVDSSNKARKYALAKKYRTLIR